MSLSEAMEQNHAIHVNTVQYMENVHIADDGLRSGDEGNGYFA